MAVYVVGLVFFLCLASYSDANYCVCNTGLSDSVLQKNIDYACGNGADCSQINQNGACFNPNTVHDHCNYAVNSYYQKKASLPGSCDFSGTATVTSTPPTASSGCVYPSGSSNAGGTTPPSTGTPTGGTPPSTGTPTGGTPGTPNMGGTPTTPNMGGTPTTPGTFPGGGSATPGSPGTPGFGLGPTGSGGFGNTDGSGAGPKLLSQSSISFSLILISAFVYAMI